MADPAHARLWPQCANRWRWSEHVPWADGHAPAPRPVLVVLAATAHLRAHGLGGTTASLPRALGTGAPTTATILGHAQPSTTLDFYGHAIPSNVRTAAGQLTHPPGATGLRAARRRRTRG
jgi:hypothetical protein